MKKDELFDIKLNKKEKDVRINLIRRILMKIEEIEEIKNNKNFLEKEFANHNVIKEKLSSKQKFYHIPFFIVGVFEFFLPLFLMGILAAHININVLFGATFIAISIFSYIVKMIATERTYIGSLFNFFTKQKLKNKGIKKDSDLFNYLSEYYLNEKEINETYEYYINLKSDKSLFFERHYVDNYIKNRIFDYISFNSVEYIKENKNKLSEIIADLNLDDYDISEIKDELKYKLNQEREKTKQDILKIFKEDEILEEKEKKELKNKVLLEI
tara:strand:- start:2188 stop:2997 length:810 start_codon:yes stop_codon:yes gene_type:complete